HFDSSDPSGDHTIVASTRSELGGLGESAFLLLEGGKNPIEVNDAYVPSNPSGQQYLPVRHLSSIAIAPTFDSSATAGLLDIYGTAGPNLFRLDFDVNAPNGSGYVWTWLGEHPSTGLITALVVDPSWSRSPSSPYPVLWATTVDSPYILRITDNGGSAATFDMVDTVGMDSFVRGLALSHSFANDNTLYVSTSGTGVHKLDVGPFLAGSSSALQWNRVGKDYPPYLSLPLGSAVTGLGADLLITGTEVGFAYGSDNPNQAWQTIATDSSVDDLDPGFTTYSPRNPSNTQGYRPWPWSTIDADYVERTRKVETHGGTVTFVRDNGAWFHWEGLARELTLEAIGGPGMGKVDLELFDLKTGALINSMLGVDLNASFFENRPITITGTANQAVYLDVHARLQGGKTFAFDGLIVKH
ncbi:MAG TPA: hypothetical protein QGG59_01605, partial [Planctomycetota bacterium]|nr:hypothetical protein [Planctomycetota bacterium]